MVVFTDCKINIGLNITRKRPDGYHDLVTCMIPVPWHDILEIIPADGDISSLKVLGRHIDCPPESNLVMKAYRALEKEYNLPSVQIILDKIIPDGAGLGGGSSDATHTLKALNSMFGLGIADADLASIAARLGADCPFFVYDIPMICEGIGDILTPIDLNLSGYTILIAKPEGVNISTKQAYACVTPHEPECDLAVCLKLPVDQWRGLVVNDFEKSIFPIAPQIAELKNMMYAQGAVYASMSGSGASVFGIFDSDKLAEQARKKVAHMPNFIFTF